MKSIWIMFSGLGIAIFGSWRMVEESSFLAAKPFWIVGGVILAVGMLINHWEHTRR